MSALPRYKIVLNKRLEDMVRPCPCLNAKFLHYIVNTERRVAKESHESFLFRRQYQCFPACTAFAPDHFDPLPRPFQCNGNSIRDKLDPSGQIAPSLLHRSDCVKIFFAAFPVDLIYRKDMIGVHLPAIQLPRGKKSPHPAVSVAEGVNMLDLVVQDSGRNDGRQAPTL